MSRLGGGERSRVFLRTGDLDLDRRDETAGGVMDRRARLGGGLLLLLLLLLLLKLRDMDRSLEGERRRGAFLRGGGESEMDLERERDLEGDLGLRSLGPVGGGLEAAAGGGGGGGIFPIFLTLSSSLLLNLSFSFLSASHLAF